MALADMAGVEHHALPPTHHHAAAAAIPQQAATEHEEEEELASTRLSLELGNVGLQSSPCSSGAGQQHQAMHAAAVTGYGTSRPRNVLTEAEKEAKRLRRVLANRESARQTILRRQAIRDELARKVADLASQNENMKKEKDMVLEQYISLKETNKQLKQQVAKTTKKKPSSTPATSTPMDIAPSAHHAEASPPPTPPQPSFLYSAPPPTMPVPYVWGSWPPGAYDHVGNPAGAAGHAPPPLCLPPPCAWYYPVVAAADPRGSPPSYVQPFQEPAASPGDERTAGEGTDEDDDPCSLTLAIDAADEKSAAAAGANAHQSSGGVVGAAVGLQVALSGREKAATAAEARRRRKELTRLKQMHAGSRHGASDHW
ncbi:hypothetical protein ACQ4PT_011223 [Festuca glaucescens]